MISIHALTRSATIRAALAYGFCRFQSTHSRGVRRKRVSFCLPCFAFQSTHSRGVRQELFKAINKEIAISIHALTRSATPFQVMSKLCDAISIHALTRSATTCTTSVRHKYFYFNPRTHEECDGKRVSFRLPSFAFQSTHSRGVRPRLSIHYYPSRPISIHALTRSATAMTETIEEFFPISIHALTRSATFFVFYFDGIVFQFQSTHSRGVRLD